MLTSDFSEDVFVVEKKKNKWTYATKGQMKKKFLERFMKKDTKDKSKRIQSKKK